MKICLEEVEQEGVEVEAEAITTLRRERLMRLVVMLS